MESPTSMTNAVDDFVPIEIPGWEANANGYVLRMEAEAVARRSQDAHPPQLIFHFLLQTTISPSTGAVERAYFAIDEPYQNIVYEAAWDEETRWMLSHVAADHVRTAELLDLLLLAFRTYTRAVLDRFPIMELSTMEFFSDIEIPSAPSSSTATNDDNEPVRGLTPTPTAAAEELQMKIAGKSDVCSICLEDFDVTTRVLEMPCRHTFHDECLTKWLTRSNTCPLCRFALPAE